MPSDFHDWIACPGCDEREDVSTLAYKTEVIFECYECGRTGEFTIGGDVPLQSFDADSVGGHDDDGT